MSRRGMAFWKWGAVCLLVGSSLACGDEEERLLETATQTLLVNCGVSTADFGTLEMVFVRADFTDGPDVLEFVVLPQGGPVALDCGAGIPEITLGPVHRLPLGQAVFAFQFMGTGGCSPQLHQVLAQAVVVCNLAAATDMPASCPVTTQPLACAAF